MNGKMRGQDGEDGDLDRNALVILQESKCYEFSSPDVCPYGDS